MANVVTPDTLDHLYNFLCNSNKDIILKYNNVYANASVEELIELGNQRDDVAFYELATRYYCGTDSIARDFDKALQYYFPVLKMKRNACAALNIGMMIWNDAYGKEKEEECLKWFLLASSWGLGVASGKVASFYKDYSNGNPDYEKLIYYYSLAVEQGATECYEDLAFTYQSKAENEDGEIKKQDYKQALEFFKKSYDSGNTKSTFCLGLVYLMGCSGEIDFVSAKKYFLEAVNCGIEDAYYYAGLVAVYDDAGNENIESNFDVAMEYLNKASADMKYLAYDTMGDYCAAIGKTKEAIGYYQMAINLGNEKSVEKYKELVRNINEEKSEADRPAEENKHRNSAQQPESVQQKENPMSGQKISESTTAFKASGVDDREVNIKQLIAESNKGKIENSFIIAQAYHYGRNGATIDYEKAYIFYKTVIQNSLPDTGEALYEIGTMFLRGQGCPINMEEAFSYYLKADEHGYPVGITKIADCYRKGLEVDKNPQKAMGLYLAAIDRGDVTALASLGEMYLKGEVDGVCDIKQGSRLIISAYEKDPENPIVVSYMANIFVNGYEEDGKIVIEKNIIKAIPLLEKLSDADDVSASATLSNLYCDRKTVFYDYEKANIYCQRLVDNHIPSGEMNMALLHLTEMYSDELMYDPKKGIEAAKKYVFNPGADCYDGSKEMLLELLTEHFKPYGIKSQYVRKECHYFLDNIEKIGLCYTNEDNKNKLKKALFNIIAPVAVELLDNPMFGVENLLQQINETEIIFRRNQYLGDAGIETMGYLFNQIGEDCLKDEEYDKAKYYFEQAAWRGSEEARKQLPRFSISFWGKLEYK